MWNLWADEVEETRQQCGACVTYVLYAASFHRIKIGKSIKPRERLATCRTGSPDQLDLLGTKSGDHEASLHGSLARWRLHGEWFTVNEFVREEVLRVLGVVIPSEAAYRQRAKLHPDRTKVTLHRAKRGTGRVWRMRWTCRATNTSGNRISYSETIGDVSKIGRPEAEARRRAKQDAFDNGKASG